MLRNSWTKTFSLLILLILVTACGKSDPPDPGGDQPTAAELFQQNCRIAGGYVEHRDDPKTCRNIHTKSIIKL